MSMISAQIDELRDYASRADGTFPLLASALRDAADLILELRDDLQQANAENAKLIVKLNAEHIARQNVEIENAKLRELVRDMLYDAMENVCSKAYWCDEKDWQTCNDEECGNRLYVEMARELGVEGTNEQA